MEYARRLENVEMKEKEYDIPVRYKHFTIVIRKLNSHRWSYKLINHSTNQSFCAWCRQLWYDDQETALDVAKLHADSGSPLPRKIKKFSSPIKSKSTMSNLTFGQRAVGITFNPSGDPAVNKVKQAYADIIDDLHFLRMNTTSAEVKRHCAVAITDAETAQMRAVKALTWKDPVEAAMEKESAAAPPINFQEDVIEKSKQGPVLVDFYTTTCRPCQDMMPHLEELASKQDFTLVKVNCEKEIALSRQFEVRSVPRLILFLNGDPVFDSADKGSYTGNRIDAVAAKIDEIRGIKKTDA